MGDVNSLVKTSIFCIANVKHLANFNEYMSYFKTQTVRIVGYYKAVFPKVRIYLYSTVILTYLLTTRRVPGYPTSYPVGYPGNELPDNGSPTVE